MYLLCSETKRKHWKRKQSPAIRKYLNNHATSCITCNALFKQSKQGILTKVNFNWRPLGPSINDASFGPCARLPITYWPTLKPDPDGGIWRHGQWLSWPGNFKCDSHCQWNCSIVFNVRFHCCHYCSSWNGCPCQWTIFIVWCHWQCKRFIGNERIQNENSRVIDHDAKSHRLDPALVCFSIRYWKGLLDIYYN